MTLTEAVRRYQEARKARLDLLEEYRNVRDRLREARRLEMNALNKVAWVELPKRGAGA